VRSLPRSPGRRVSPAGRRVAPAGRHGRVREGPFPLRRVWPGELSGSPSRRHYAGLLRSDGGGSRCAPLAGGHLGCPVDGQAARRRVPASARMGRRPPAGAACRSHPVTVTPPASGPHPFSSRGDDDGARTMRAGRVPGAPADCPRPTGCGSGGTPRGERRREPAITADRVRQREGLTGHPACSARRPRAGKEVFDSTEFPAPPRLSGAAVTPCAPAAGHQH